MVVVLGLVAAAPAEASFPGADGRVVFSSGGDLHSVLPDGSGLQALTTTPGLEEAQASWSPDGSRVAFRVGTAGTGDVLQIAVMNADGSGRTVLTSGDRHNSQPAWSPDGREIVFRHSVPGIDLSGDIWIMGADGSSPRPLIARAGDERYPSLSPDGRRLAFTTRSAGEDVEIAVADLDSGAVTALTDNAEFDSSPSWSPDGRRIAFERGPAGDDPGNDVWSMAADGADQRRLTTTAGLDEGPSWSPSGSRIAFTSARSGTSDIWTMAADGTDQQPLAALAGTQESPDWQTLPVGLPADATVQPSPATPLPARPSAPKVAVKLAPGQTLRTVRRRGLAVRLACASACTLDVRLLLDRTMAKRLHLRATVGRAGGRLGGAGTKRLTIRLASQARARLATVRSARFTLRVTARADGRRQTVQRRVVLVRGSQRSASATMR
jgi:Tol biopolymer transport system component